MTTLVEKALENVDKYGALHFPVGKDRAALCHAACVLSAEVRRLRVELEDANRIMDIAGDYEKWKEREDALRDAREIAEANGKCARELQGKLDDYRSRLASAERVLEKARAAAKWHHSLHEAITAKDELIAALTHHDQEAAEGKI